MIRESLLMNYADQSLVLIAGDEKNFVAKFSPFVHAANAYRFMNEINTAQQHIERNGSAKIIFMDISFKANELLNVPNPDLVK
jgi:DNA polymerase-3 subunit delta'